MPEVLKKYRCAIYTRKSHEEGLEQAFNSLDAQREAGVAYVQSQKHEGWSVIATHYDDGGYSGGSISRPALQKLLEDVRAGKIDVIVVYKVDRLSRSINDFATMMTLFDKENVSFVSVTQQFNTTTSMGRLTLNMLLSFAQFEREVTGERIRDKFAASKQKGIWMGGCPPLGYDIKNRLLLINQPEAVLVKSIFEMYLVKPSPLTISNHFNQLGHTVKHWESQTGNWHGGKPLTPSYIQSLLNNPIYLGKTKHKDKLYEGEHQAIIDQNLWDKVHSLIKKRKACQHQKRTPFLLTGKIKTHEDATLSPSTSRRSPKRGNGIKQSTRYYISQKAMTHGHANCPIKMLNAEIIEDIIKTQLLDYLNDKQKHCFDYYQSLTNSLKQFDWLRSVIASITVSTDKLIIRLDKSVIENVPPTLTDKHTSIPLSHRAHYFPTIHEQSKCIELHLSIQIKKTDGKRLVLSQDGKDLILPTQLTPNASIAQAIGRAFKWKEILNQNEKTILQLAKEINVANQYVRRILMLVNLAPDILHQALTGTLLKSITLTTLQTAAKHLNWQRQKALLGI
jgi:DNA invertase Pin-like site-specific DNA recombinase